MLFSVVGGWLGLNVVHNFESCRGWENLPHLWCNFEALTNLNLDVKYLWQTHGSAHPRDVEGQPPWKKVKIYLRCPWWGKKRMLKQASVILEKWNCLRLNVKLKVKIGFIHLDTKEGGRFPKSCCSDCKKKIDRGLHTYFTNSSCRPAYISNIEGQNEAIYANLAYILPLCTTEPYWLG